MKNKNKNLFLGNQNHNKTIKLLKAWMKPIYKDFFQNPLIILVVHFHYFLSLIK